MEKFRELVQGWLGTFLMVLLLVPFAFFGIESYFSGGHSQQAVATVNGEDLTQPEFDRAFDAERQQMLSQLPPDADPSRIALGPLRQKVLDALINRSVERQAAEALGLIFPDNQVWPLIAQIPAFQGEDGKFDPNRFQMFLRSRGFTEAGLIHDIEVGGQIQQLEIGMSSAFTPAPEVQRLLALDAQSRDVGYVVVPQKVLLGNVHVTPGEVDAYFKAHAAAYQVPERAKVDYIELHQDDLRSKVQVTAEDIAKAYQDAVKSLAAQQQRHAQHILIKVDAQTPDAVALQKIRSIAAQLQPDGSNFSDLAKKYSQDPGSASNGGDLGYADKGQFVPQFDQVLFALKPGEMSQPVRTQFGYHIIRLIDIKKSDVPSMDSMKEQLTQAVQQQKLAQLFSDQVNDMNDTMYEASDLKDPSQKYHLPIQTTDWFSAQSGTSIASSPKLRAMAFTDDVLHDGKNSAVVELAKGDVVWIHLNAHEAARPQTEQEARPAIEALLITQKAQQTGHAEAQAWKKAIEQGASPASVVKINGVQWVTQSINRSSKLPDNAMLETLYWMPRPDQGHPSIKVLDLKDGIALLQVLAVHDTDASHARIPADQAAKMLNQIWAAQYEADFIHAIKSHAKVVTTSLGQSLLQGKTAEGN